MKLIPSKQKPQVLFLQVTTPQLKLAAICKTAQRHFNEKKSLLILAPTIEVEDYIDQLLWRYPEESFLPHTKVDDSAATLEYIVISSKNQNPSKAKILFNLCPMLPLLANEFELIY